MYWPFAIVCPEMVCVLEVPVEMLAVASLKPSEVRELVNAPWLGFVIEELLDQDTETLGEADPDLH
ncbi:MAG: hypothetical protein ACK5C5_10575, partial [Bacteroidota bacterium]